MSNDNHMTNLIKAATVMRRHHSLDTAPPDLLEALKTFDTLPEYYKASTWDEYCRKAQEQKAGLT